MYEKRWFTFCRGTLCVYEIREALQGVPRFRNRVLMAIDDCVVVFLVWELAAGRAPALEIFASKLSLKNTRFGCPNLGD